MENNYEPVIGLEIHIELKTNSKMFCACPADHFGKSPNTQTCPVCLGLPGALPVPNQKAIDWTVLMGLAFNCQINQHSKFDRKNYFYPDLPKAFQISQYDMPFAFKGAFTLNGKNIGITRIHLEEDTGKLQHATIDGEQSSLIDYNRSGVPLVEIVTEPELKSSSEAKEFLQEIQKVVRKLGVSDCDMEKGSMRLEANVSVRKVGETKLPPYKVELKNINSFRFLERAVNFDIERQTEILKQGQIPQQETRGYSETKDQTFSQRLKEETQEYRYFPEPDIPPIEITSEKSSQIKSVLPEMPSNTRDRLVGEFGLSLGSAAIISTNPPYLELFESAVKHQPNMARDVANLLVNKRYTQLPRNGQELLDLLSNASSQNVTDESRIREVVEQVASENEKIVVDIKSGKTQARFALIGKIRAILGQIDIPVTQKIIDEIIDQKG